MTNIKELIDEGRTLELYLESEQSDQGDDNLDEVFQSIYDVYHLVIVGIIEGELEDEAMIEAKQWLEKSKSSTQEYHNLEV